MSEELARRAVACEGWRWMEGMLALPPKADRCRLGGQLMPGRLPDLSDPATLGCLLALVREAWAPDGFFYLEYIPEGKRWVGVYACDGAPANVVGARTEAEALVAALEIVSGREGYHPGDTIWIKRREVRGDD